MTSSINLNIKIFKKVECFRKCIFYGRLRLLVRIVNTNAVKKSFMIFLCKVWTSRLKLQVYFRGRCLLYFVLFVIVFVFLCRCQVVHSFLRILFHCCFVTTLSQVRGVVKRSLTGSTRSQTRKRYFNGSRVLLEQCCLSIE